MYIRCLFVFFGILSGLRRRVVYVLHKAASAAPGAEKQPVRHVFPSGEKRGHAARFKPVSAMRAFVMPLFLDAGKTDQRKDEYAECGKEDIYDNGNCWIHTILLLT